MGPFPRQHPFGITDLVQISGIESQLGYKILAPRGFFTVVGSYHDSDIAGGGEGIGRQLYKWTGLQHMWATPRQPSFHWREFLRLDFLFNLLDFYSVLHESVLRFLHLHHLSFSLSPTCWGIYLQKNWWKNFLKSVAAESQARYELSHLRRKHHTTVNKSALRNQALYFIHRNSAMTALPPWRNKQGALTHPVSFHSHFYSLWSDAPLKPADISSAQCAKRNTSGVNNFTMLRSHSASLCVFNLWLA